MYITGTLATFQRQIAALRNKIAVDSNRMIAAFHTILWCGRLDTREKIRAALRCIRSHGFRGVEFAESPQDLLTAMGNIRSLRGLLEELDLDFVGICGGTLDEKAMFVTEMRPYWESRVLKLGVPPPHVYVEDWDDEIPKLLDEGIRVALHLHYPTRMSTVDTILKRDERLRWLPDTAHLWISGVEQEDIESAILKYKTRLAAVHLKDWTDQYGKTSYRYAKGFREPGEGSLGPHLENLVISLRKSGFAQWAVAEIDYPRSTERSSVRKCAQWFAQHGIRLSPTTDTCPPTDSLNTEIGLASHLTRLGAYGDPDFHVHAVEAIQTHFSEAGCVGVGILAYVDDGCSGQPTYVPIAASGPWKAFGTPEFRAAMKVASKCLKTRRMVDIELPSYSSQISGLAQKIGASRLVSVPICSVYNSNQIRACLFLAFRDRDGKRPLTNHFRAVARRLARASDIAVTERCMAVSRLASDLIQDNRDVESFERALVTMIQKEISCSGLTIFQADGAGTLTASSSSTTGLVWNSSIPELKRLYSSSDNSLTGQVLRDRQPLFLRNAKKFRHKRKAAPPKSREDVAVESRETCLFVPYVSRAGALRGVVRCRNRRDVLGQVRPFDEDDLVLIEAIIQAAAPDLDLLRTEQQRGRAIGTLFHELSQPIDSVQSAIVMAQQELDRNPTFFKQDYLGDARSWIELSNRLLASFDFLNWQMRDLQPKRTWVLPLRDLIAPSVRQVRSLLLDRGFSEYHIDYGDEKAIKEYPRLYVDANMFQQVVFNLLTNSIKYALPKPRDFRIHIRGEQKDGRCFLYFRDYGLGIDEAWKDIVFQEGVRVSDAAHIPGRGLGLWVVKKIVTLHGGIVSITNCRNPTEITISLPFTISTSR